MLSSKIGKRVHYGAPNDVRKKGGRSKSGKIVDEVWANKKLNASHRRRRKSVNDWGDYSFCAQLIKWESGEHSIRLAYYRRRAGEERWQYASQMTVDTGWKTIKALLQSTLAKENWFRDNPTLNNPYRKRDL